MSRLATTILVSAPVADIPHLFGYAYCRILRVRGLQKSTAFQIENVWDSEVDVPVKPELATYVSKIVSTCSSWAKAGGFRVAVLIQSAERQELERWHFEMEACSFLGQSRVMLENILSQISEVAEELPQLERIESCSVSVKAFSYARESSIHLDPFKVFFSYQVDILIGDCQNFHRGATLFLSSRSTPSVRRAICVIEPNSAHSLVFTTATRFSPEEGIALTLDDPSMQVTVDAMVIIDLSTGHVAEFGSAGLWVGRPTTASSSGTSQTPRPLSQPISEFSAGSSRGSSNMSNARYLDAAAFDGMESDGRRSVNSPNSVNKPFIIGGVTADNIIPTSPGPAVSPGATATTTCTIHLDPNSMKIVEMARQKRRTRVASLPAHGSFADGILFISSNAFGGGSRSSAAAGNIEEEGSDRPRAIMSASSAIRPSSQGSLSRMMWQQHLQKKQQQQQQQEQQQQGQEQQPDELQQQQSRPSTAGSRLQSDANNNNNNNNEGALFSPRTPDIDRMSQFSGANSPTVFSQLASNGEGDYDFEEYPPVNIPPEWQDRIFGDYEPAQYRFPLHLASDDDANANEEKKEGEENAGEEPKQPETEQEQEERTARRQQHRLASNGIDASEDQIFPPPPLSLISDEAIKRVESWCRAIRAQFLHIEIQGVEIVAFAVPERHSLQASQLFQACMRRHWLRLEYCVLMNAGHDLAAQARRKLFTTATPCRDLAAIIAQAMVPAPGIAASVAASDTGTDTSAASDGEGGRGGTTSTEASVPAAPKKTLSMKLIPRRIRQAIVAQVTAAALKEELEFSTSLLASALARSWRQYIFRMIRSFVCFTQSAMRRTLARKQGKSPYMAAMKLVKVVRHRYVTRRVRRGLEAVRTLVGFAMRLSVKLRLLRYSHGAHVLSILVRANCANSLWKKQRAAACLIKAYARVGHTQLNYHIRKEIAAEILERERIALITRALEEKRRIAGLCLTAVARRSVGNRSHGRMLFHGRRLARTAKTIGKLCLARGGAAHVLKNLHSLYDGEAHAEVGALGWFRNQPPFRLFQAQFSRVGARRNWRQAMAAITIKAAIKRRMSRTRYRRMVAAITLQAFSRRRAVRLPYRRRTAAMRIQAIWRRIPARRRWRYTLAAHQLQRFARWFVAVRSPAWKKNSCIVQSILRRAIQRREFILAWMEVVAPRLKNERRSSARLITALGRAIPARRKFINMYRIGKFVGRFCRGRGVTLVSDANLICDVLMYFATEKAMTQVFLQKQMAAITLQARMRCVTMKIIHQRLIASRHLQRISRARVYEKRYVWGKAITQIQRFCRTAMYRNGFVWTNAAVLLQKMFRFAVAHHQYRYSLAATVFQGASRRRCAQFRFRSNNFARVIQAAARRASLPFVLVRKQAAEVLQARIRAAVRHLVEAAVVVQANLRRMLGQFYREAMGRAARELCWRICGLGDRRLFLEIVEENWALAEKQRRLHLPNQSKRGGSPRRYHHHQQSDAASSPLSNLPRGTGAAAVLAARAAAAAAAGYNSSFSSPVPPPSKPREEIFRSSSPANALAPNNNQQQQQQQLPPIIVRNANNNSTPKPSSPLLSALPTTQLQQQQQQVFSPQPPPSSASVSSPYRSPRTAVYRQGNTPSSPSFSPTPVGSQYHHSQQQRGPVMSPGGRLNFDSSPIQAWTDSHHHHHQQEMFDELFYSHSEIYDATAPLSASSLYYYNSPRETQSAGDGGKKPSEFFHSMVQDVFSVVERENKTITRNSEQPWGWTFPRKPLIPPPTAPATFYRKSDLALLPRPPLLPKQKSEVERRLRHSPLFVSPKIKTNGPRDY